MSAALSTPGPVEALAANHRRFVAFLESRVGSREDAEDILQAAFVKSIEKADSIRNEESVVAWFYRLLRNTLIDHYRHHGAERTALERTAGFAIEATEPDRSVEQAICQCVNDLLPTIREDYARLLRRVELEGASVAEVAAHTGMRPGNVRVRLHRARLALRKQLELSCRTCTEHGCLDCTCERSS